MKFTQYFDDHFINISYISSQMKKLWVHAPIYNRNYDILNHNEVKFDHILIMRGYHGHTTERST